MLLKEWFAFLLFGAFLYGLFLLGRDTDRWEKECRDRGGRHIGSECVAVRIIESP
jgi:hypothetical protein